MTAPLVVLHPRRARPFFARHPWVYASSIARVEGSPALGDDVRVTSAEGVFIARGLWNAASALRVRLYHWIDIPLDNSCWRTLIKNAVALRNNLPDQSHSNAQRVVFSEGDGLSGLTADRFDRWLIAPFTSAALWSRREEIIPSLLEDTGCEGAHIKFDSSVAKLEGVTNPLEELHGTLPQQSIEIQESGVRFLVDLGAGQKTGFYLDQATNRLAAARYAQGRDVLDICCYTGGFGLHAAVNGAAASVLGIDSSEPAITRARENASLNLANNIEFRVDDAHRALQQLDASSRKFDMAICDPPKYARSARDLDDAVKAYIRLNLAVLRVLKPGAILVTCSCSGNVDASTFQSIISNAAERAGRTVQMLEMRGQAPDHPVAVACPETEYLKCAVCRVT